MPLAAHGALDKALNSPLHERSPSPAAKRTPTGSIRERLSVGMFVLQRPFAKLSASNSASASSLEMSVGQP